MRKLWDWLRRCIGRKQGTPPEDARQALGRDGERVAERYLRGAGMRVVARRFRTPVGELDLVMRDGSELVFVEVKTQRSASFAPPQDRVGRDKQRRVVQAARWFVRQRGLEALPMRFDVVAVVWPEGGPPQVRHLPDAFPAETGSG